MVHYTHFHLEIQDILQVLTQIHLVNHIINFALLTFFYIQTLLIFIIELLHIMTILIDLYFTSI